MQAVAEADRALRQAVAADAPAETIGELAGRLGDVYQANTFSARADACYRLAAELDGANPRWPYFLAHLRQERGEVEAVTPLLERTLELDPAYAPAWLRLGDNQFKLGQAVAARRAYERRLNLVAGDPWAQLGLARLEIERSNWELAESHLTSAPEFGPAQRLLASVHDHYGRPGPAAESRRRADALGPFHPAPDPWIDALLTQSFDVDWLLFHVSRYAFIDPDLTRTLFDGRAAWPRGTPTSMPCSESTLARSRRRGGRSKWRCRSIRSTPPRTHGWARRST